MSREKIIKNRKRRGFNILKIKLKSKFIRLTKETTTTFKIMILGLVLIIAILGTKYKPVYEVKINNEVLGLVSSKSEFDSLIEENLTNKVEKNIDNISLEFKPQYELKFANKSKETNEVEILKELENNYLVTTYKYYAVLLNEKSATYVDTVEEAEEVVEQIKSEFDGNGLDLNLAITEIYTQNEEEIKTENVQNAENTVQNGVEELIEEKEAKEAIARINGINLAVLPVSGGYISSRFSDISRVRSYRPHTGLDIACDSGTDIKVVSKGTVVYAGWDENGLGNVVKVDHGNGVQTWYGHCSKIYVSTGDTVKAGDVISAVGSTGNSTGPHLHFEIRVDGDAVNPQMYLYNR